MPRHSCCIQDFFCQLPNFIFSPCSNLEPATIIRQAPTPHPTTSFPTSSLQHYPFTVAANEALRQRPMTRPLRPSLTASPGPRPRCKSGECWILSLMKRNDLHYPIKVEVWRFHTDEGWWVWGRHFAPRLWEAGGTRGNTAPASLGLSPQSTGGSTLSRTLELTMWKSLVEGTEQDFRMPSHI